MSNFIRNGYQVVKGRQASSGQLFGNGLYFTDCVSKAALLGGANKLNPEAFLLIYTVAVGQEYKLTEPKVFDKPPTPYHSVKGVGKFAPPNFDSLNDTLFYTGTPIDNTDELSTVDQGSSSLNYNEYVVFDNDQVKLEYLVRVGVKYLH